MQFYSLTTATRCHVAKKYNIFNFNAMQNGEEPLQSRANHSKKDEKRSVMKCKTLNSLDIEQQQNDKKH